MLLGSLIYNDSVNGAVKFNVTALPLANSILLNVSQSSTDISEFYKANNVFHRSEERPEYEDCGVGSVRVDIAKSIKTNAVNLEFASRLGTTIKYALSMPTNNSIIKIEKPLYQQFIADYKIGTASFYVTHHNGIVDGVKIKTDYLELSLETGDSDFIFSPLKAKDKYGNKLYSTPISIIAVKLTKENLGFTPPKKKSAVDIPTFGMYQTIEEVIAAHPDKNTDWILDRKYQIASKDNFESIVKEFQDWDGMIAFDTETTGLNITFKSAQGEGDTLTGVVLSKEKGTGVYFPLGHTQFENLCNGDIDYFMQTYMKPILENKQIICHNTAFDWKVAYLYGINTNVVFDTMIAFLCTYRYVYGKNYEAGLKALAKNILGLDMFELEDFTIGDWGDGVNFSMLPYELVRRYAPADGDMTLSLYDWIKENQLLEQYNAVRVHDLEVEFAKAVAYSEYWGYSVDMANLPKMIEDTLAAKEQHMNNMFKLAGHDFNPNSPQQLKKIMYEELGIEKIGGQDSTKAEILKELSKMEDVNGNKLYPFVSELLSYRSHEGTVKNFINHKDDFLTQDGFIFPHIFAFGTDTGRVSIKEPNYQSYDKLVKHYIVPRDGFYMFDCDFSQIEYRVLASMAGQENLCKALEDPDMDYHTYQASRMFNVPYASVTSDLRKQSKGINFGLPYGMEDRSLGKRIFGQATPENTAKAADLRKKYFQGQEKILNFFEVVRAQGVSRNYTETWLGRRRYYNKNQFSVSSIRRQAGNQVIQGCLDGDTRIQTKELGIVKIKDVAGYSMQVWDGKKWTFGDIMYSGKKRKCIVRFKGGQSIVCSPIHKFLVVDTHGKEHWVECQDLKFGYKSSANNSHVRINESYESSDFRYSSKFAYKYKGQAHNSNNVFLENIGDSYKIGIFLGRLASDGFFSARKDGGSYIQQFISEHEYNILPALRDCMSELGYSEVNLGVREGRTEGMVHLNVYSSSLVSEISELDIKHQVHNNIFMDTEVLRGFLSGFFDGDGGISGKTITLTFGSQYDFEPMCLDIQKALLFLGIRSRYYKYDDRYKIIIKTNDNVKFLDLIGFVNQTKQEQGRTLTCKERESTFGRCIIVDSVEITDEYIDMYDVCNTDDGYYVADGIITHNTAADIFKMAVVSLFNRICKEGWLGKVLFNAFIHDEMLCEVHSSISPYKFLKAWREEYQVKIKGFCPLYAGCGFGKNWYEAKSQDLPPQFIQECIDRADEPWNENTSEFLKKCNDNFFDYKVRRVKDFITDKNNDGQVIKPLVNALLLETMQDKTGVKEKEIIAKYPKLSDRIVRYKEIFNIQDESFNILPPEDASSSASQTKAVDSSVVIPEMTSIDLIVNSVKNYGVGVDINDMKLYLRFEPSKQSLMNFIRGICSDTNNGGYRLMFVVFDKSYKIMSTPYYITCMDAMQLQQLYAKL